MANVNHLLLVLIISFGSVQFCLQYPEVILSSVNIYAMKTRATYSCSAADAIAANWYMNGTNSRELNLTNTTEFFFNRTNVGIFIFKYLTGVYNNTHVQCEAVFPTKSPVRSGNNKTLIIQGYLSAVANVNSILIGDNITLSWEAPFTLDIPRVNPDITYCVDITSNHEIVHSECDIHSTYYNYSFYDGFPQCRNISASVTPVNIVGNGTSTALYLKSEEEFTCTESTTIMKSTTSTRMVHLRTNPASKETVNNDTTPKENSSVHIKSSSLQSFSNSRILLIIAVPVTLILILIVIIVVIAVVLAVRTINLRKQKVGFLENKQYRASSKSGELTNRYYDVILNTCDPIYEEIKGKAKKSPEIETNDCEAYTRFSRPEDIHKISSDASDAKVCFSSTNWSIFTAPNEESTPYETIPGDRTSPGSDINTAQCPAYGTL